MDVFSFRDRVVEDYGQFSRSFTQIKAPDLRDFVDGRYGAGEYWPSPLIQLNPSFVGEAASGPWWRRACCTRNAAASSAGARTGARA